MPDQNLIADVTARHVDFADAHIGIRWHTGAVDEAVCAGRTNRTPSQAIAITRDLLDTGSDAEIADHLNQLGLRTGNARPLTAASIRFVRHLRSAKTLCYASGDRTPPLAVFHFGEAGDTPSARLLAFRCGEDMFGTSMGFTPFGDAVADEHERRQH